VQDFYTRDGSFTLNSNGFLTVAGTGMLVQRTGTLGEPTESQIGFQTPGDSSIKIPLGTTIQGSATKTASFSGNLPSNAKPPVIEVLTSKSPFETGGLAATGATLLDTNSVD
jgi:flagellar hook protein FlgE